MDFKIATTHIKDLYDLSKSNLKGLLNKEFTINGWIRSMRQNSKTLAFVSLYDGSYQETLQIVFHTENDKDKTFESLFSVGQTGVSISATGIIIESEGGQPFEMQANKVHIFGIVADKYPMAKSKKALSMEFLREQQHLRVRTNTFGALARIRSELIIAMHHFFHSSSFTFVDLPFITESECEGGANPLQVTTLLTDKRSDIPTINTPKELVIPASEEIDYTKDFFGKKVYLTVSAQLHLETYACALTNVYTMTRAFRGEPSNSTRHLAELNMLEWETCFTSLENNIDIAESFIKHCIGHVLEHCMPEMAFFDKIVRPGLIKELQAMYAEAFIKTTHEEAITLLRQHVEQGKVKFNSEPKYDDDLANEHEKYLVHIYGKPCVVRYYPKPVKAFYMPVVKEKETKIGDKVIERVNCYDLLTRIGELVGGSQRIDNYDELVARMDELKMNKTQLDWYLDLRRYGSVPHGGAGIGFERLVMLLTGIDNIRDTVPFYRTVKDCKY
jgi:asparaginyl-tRNA synthetase